MKQIIQTIREKYAPDKRVEIFDIWLPERSDSLILEGETSSRPAYEALLSEVRKKFPEAINRLRLLPTRELGDKTWGVVYNSVGTLRSEPRYGAELVSQALLGTPVRILDKKEGWCRVQTPDRYIGWINGSVEPMTEHELHRYNALPKIIVTSFYAQSFEKPDTDSQTVSDLVAGNMLAVEKEENGFYAVRYSDGRKGYVACCNAQRVEDWLEDAKPTAEKIAGTAFRFKGVPYLWGGTSLKGVDCSGFTKSVYFLHGIVLTRDASQQVLYGSLIDERGDWSNALPGDLVFFGEKASGEDFKERVVHVGIYIGGKRFIHASDYIRVNSFDPKDPLYDAHNTSRYLRTKRIIGEVNTQGIEEIGKNQFYQ